MARHLADRRTASTGGRLRHFLRLGRQESSVWKTLWKKAPAAPAKERGAQEFLRMERGREA